ncbi:MAG TPA: metallophosphoesterase, partial [Candidatus Korarchaeota archaeon]|nr:metallophosphoesterase [Candidatus Korarchaeota archaeon]
REILAFHGFGSLSLTEKVARVLADCGEYDVVLFGHTHSPVVEKRGSLLVNPGEASGKLTGRKTAALVDLENLEAEIVEL